MKKLIVSFFVLVFVVSNLNSQTPFTAKEGLPKAFEFAKSRLGDSISLYIIHSDSFLIIGGTSYYWSYTICSSLIDTCIDIKIKLLTNNFTIEKTNLLNKDVDWQNIDTNFIYTDSINFYTSKYCENIVYFQLLYNPHLYINNRKLRGTLWNFILPNQENINWNDIVMFDPQSLECLYLQDDVKDISNNNVYNSCRISPNPASEKININLNVNITNLVNIKIINNLGIPVIEKVNQELIANKSLEINISNLQPGIYFCNINSANFSETKKFVIIR